MTLDQQRWTRIKEAFAALAELGPEERAVQLEELARADAAVHQEVVALLEAADAMGDRFEGGVSFPDDLGAVVPPAALSGTMVGAWRVGEPIGQGGMGAVYQATRDDAQYRQRAALKTIPRALATEHVLQRFRHERQILARLAHPNIATLLDGGVTADGLPWFVMEYVEGEPIDRWCARTGAGPRERVALLRQVTAAVQYAHDRLVVHRDLKPGNILVTADGTVKLLDFGIAKLLDPTGDDEAPLTRTGVFPMTAGYASPEQRRGEPVSTASDIYSLGVVLYELLAGKRPDTTAGELPTAPSRAAPMERARAVAGELDAIALKALRPEPEARYRSAADLGDDLARYLDGLPVQARAGSWSYRTGKFLRRHRLAVAAFGLALAALVGGTVVSVGQARLARQERDRALREVERTARVTDFLRDVFAAARPGRLGTGVTVVAAIDSAVARADTAFAGDPDLRAALLLTLGQTMHDMYLYQRARPLLEESRRLRGELDGDRPSKEQADALYDLADIETQIGSPAKAESLYRVSIGMLGRLPEPDSADIYEALSNVAEAQLNQGHLAQAAALYDTVAGALQRLRPESVGLRAVTRANQGTALAALGRSAEAEPALREALDLFVQARGSESPQAASVLQPLAGTLVLNGKYVEAESLARRAVRINTKEFGPTNPATLSTLRMATAALVESGNCAKAEPEIRGILALRGGALADADPTLGVTLLQLGQCQAIAGRYAESETTLRDALQVRTAALGAEHWAVAQVESMLGAVLVREGKTDEGQDRLRRGYVGLERALGADHPRTREAAARADSAGVPPAR
ncbi:MAG: serine/threonine-protein kinase [Gemmatimonadales bacterium]